MLWPKINSYKEFDNEKKFLRLENSPLPPLPPITFLMVRPLKYPRIVAGRTSNWLVYPPFSRLRRQNNTTLPRLSRQLRRLRLRLTTLLERRMRGDLIETFKIINGFVNYGHKMFGTNTA